MSPVRAASVPGFRPRADRTYIAFNKPYGVLSQFTQPDESDKRTLAEFDLPAHVYAVGRLDFDSEGLLLLSDDNALNDALLNPAHAHPRTYLAQVENIPDAEALKQLCTGVEIQGRRTLPAHAELLATDPGLPPRPVPIRVRMAIPTAWIRLTLTEGRNRQVRRMTAAVGHPTLRLVRVAIGQLDLFRLGIAPGEWRILSPDEIRAALQHGG
jgi:23S rRNA pseudouridine2457 synthase